MNLLLYVFGRDVAVRIKLLPLKHFISVSQIQNIHFKVLYNSEFSVRYIFENHNYT